MFLGVINRFHRLNAAFMLYDSIEFWGFR